MLEALNDAILSAAASLWVYLLVVGIAFVDAFFPPVPSETIVVAAAALGVMPVIIVLAAGLHILNATPRFRCRNR